MFVELASVVSIVWGFRVEEVISRVVLFGNGVFIVESFFSENGDDLSDSFLDMIWVEDWLPGTGISMELFSITVAIMSSVI